MKIQNSIQKPLLNEDVLKDQKIETKKEQAKQVAEEFEAIFLQLMLENMRKTANPEDMSNAEGIYRGMLDEEYSKILAGSSELGIAENIFQFMQENDSDLKVGNQELQQLNDLNLQFSSLQRNKDFGMQTK